MSWPSPHGLLSLPNGHQRRGTHSVWTGLVFSLGSFYSVDAAAPEANTSPHDHLEPPELQGQRHLLCSLPAPPQPMHLPQPSPGASSPSTLLEALDGDGMLTKPLNFQKDRGSFWAAQGSLA